MTFLRFVASKVDENKSMQKELLHLMRTLFGHAMIRTPLKDLLPQLDAQQFWQIHRGTVVRAQAIASAQRDESGRLSLLLRERPEKLAVSRLYATRFRAM